MNVLLLGNGGREHALAWRLAQSPLCAQLYIAPGNGGTEEFGINLPVDPNDFEAVRRAVVDHNIRLVVCGPEEPLVRGIQNFFSTDDQLKAVYFIGPSKEAARLEGSKAYAKAFMEEYGIPTAGYQRFTADEMEAGERYLEQSHAPYVLKADGLAAGKGVIILNDLEESKRELRDMLRGKFGDAGTTVVVEEFLDGIEFSVFVLTDGESYRILPVAKDYKRIGAGDTGLNTGGMGSVSHPPFVDADMMRKVEQRIIQPTLKGIQARKLDYHGFIFIGLIAVEDEPYVIEYNCRMGDPETQSVMARLNNDLMQLLLETAEGGLSSAVIDMDDRQVATVVLVSGGYPGDYEKGKEITGLDAVQGSMVFQAGTRTDEEGRLVTDGGRVLAVTSYGDTYEDALAKCYENARRITFDGVNFRPDIGFDL
ncbi:phosphoribosylamine--glycine ligase [Lewinella aquimaris]|uniref:Phosphoribosylamine--glycine ligase n=1 Tax=Neolewinella aquimaris TaxID=1835722 RepID=A0A840E1B6_9BACT|nr:phosphoribosylamine--glycine ligase [Neolewinella aquimaris]MBB4077515.1 phosphoribosylamine--glycine ligase [Neolewinella aquimaris]